MKTMKTMKTFKLFLVVFFITTKIFSQQVPNGDFENWNTLPTCSTLDSLHEFSNYELELFTFVEHCPTKSSVLPVELAHSGTYGIGISPAILPLETKPLAIRLNLGDYIEKIPFNFKPSKLIGYYYFIANFNSDDSLSIAVQFSSTTVPHLGHGKFGTSSLTSNFVKFEIPIIYDNNNLGEIPDSMDIYIVVESKSNPGYSSENTKIVLDDFSFEYTTTDINSNNSLNNQLVFSFENGFLKFSNNIKSVNLISSNGAIVKKIDNEISLIDVSSYKSGVYLIKYVYNNLPYTQKFIID